MTREYERAVAAAEAADRKVKSTKESSCYRWVIEFRKHIKQLQPRYRCEAVWARNRELARNAMYQYYHRNLTETINDKPRKTRRSK